MKTCVVCGSQYARRSRETAAQWEARRFCSRACANKGRPTTRVPDEEFKARYRQVKINGRKLLEHRYVMEQMLGRPLGSSEQVHHINHNRLDNRPENLELVSTAEHGRRHTWRPTTKVCAICGASFVPHKTKRARQQTCSPECKGRLISLKVTEWHKTRQRS